MRVHESGVLVATGCDGGNVTLLEVTPGLASAHRNDKTAVTAVSVSVSLSLPVWAGWAKEMKSA